MNEKLKCGCEINIDEIKKLPVIECPNCKNEVHKTHYCTCCGIDLNDLCKNCIHQVYLQHSYYPFCKAHKTASYYDDTIINIGMCESTVYTEHCKFEKSDKPNVSPHAPSFEDSYLYKLYKEKKNENKN